MAEDNDHVICRCEQILLSEILDAIKKRGAVSPQEVKMLTRAGKGYCGGRTCGNVVARIVSAETGVAVPDLVATRSRPPVRPTLLEEVADPSVDAIFSKSSDHFDLLSAGSKKAAGQEDDGDKGAEQRDRDGAGQKDKKGD